MAAIRGGKSKYPCPHCLVPLKDMWKVVSTVHEPRTVENMKATYDQARQQNKTDAEETFKNKGLRNVFVRPPDPSTVILSLTLSPERVLELPLYPRLCRHLLGPSPCVPWRPLQRPPVRRDSQYPRAKECK